MALQSKPLEIFFLPWIATSHMMPLVDIARGFAVRGANITIITTPVNALTIQKSIDKHDNDNCGRILIHIIPFPSTEQSGLPQGCENFTQVTTVDLMIKLFETINMLQQPIEQFFRENPPDCIVSDMFYPWTADVAADLRIPRLFFNATCLFSMSVMQCIQLYAPHEKVKSDTEPFVVPGLPDPITMTRSEQDDCFKAPKLDELTKRVREAELRSYGGVVNSFYELEPAYKHHYDAWGSKTWQVGPASLILRDVDKDKNNYKDVVNEHKCLSWLDSKKDNSVVYICFGSACRFPTAQLSEIAIALEASNQQFIWAVSGKDNKDDREEEERWLPAGFEERMEKGKKGMIIRGWAPQILILDHPAIGGFLTHCGWNSILESVSARVPMITWPLYAEHFYNEKLVTQVLNIGFPIGVQDWNMWLDVGKVVQKSDKIEKAITRVMGNEEMRSRVIKLGETAKAAVKEGGSSYNNLTTLMEELKALRQKTTTNQ